MYITQAMCSGKCNVTVWCLSIPSFF